jgi:hypothetical protein
VQVEELESQFAGLCVPFRLPFPGLKDVKVPATHAIALTGSRMVVSFWRSNASAPADGPGRSTRKKPHGKAKVNGGDTEGHSRVDLAGARHLAEVMCLEAPAKMTLQDVYNLLQACDVMLADAVIQHVPAYVEPALSQAPLNEVCNAPSAVSRHRRLLSVNLPCSRCNAGASRLLYSRRASANALVDAMQR